MFWRCFCLYSSALKKINLRDNFTKIVYSFIGIIQKQMLVVLQGQRGTKHYVGNIKSVQRQQLSLQWHRSRSNITTVASRDLIQNAH